MANLCLPVSAAKALKKALGDKEIQIADLLNMSTEERTKLFETFAGKDAQKMNTLFEEKLVLKNKYLGLKNFIEKMIQEGKYNPSKKAELEQNLSDFKAQQQERIFNPSEEQAFLNDLADKTVGTHVTPQEAKNVFSLSTKMDEALADADFSPEAAKAYGEAKYAYEAYTDALKLGDDSLKALIKDALTQFKDTAKENLPKAVGNLILKAVKTVSDTSIATVASLDNSFIGRQGLKTLITHPTAWWPGTRNSFIDFYKTLKGFDQKAVLMSDLYSKENYRNGEYEKAGIIAKSEEQYPTSLPERVPSVGRVFKASQSAFEGSALRMRTQLYDLISEKAKANGVEMTDVEIKSIGKLINSLTARGQLGERGQNSAIRLVLWAPKMLKANWDVLTGHTFGSGLDSAFTRKEAALNLTKIVGTTALIMTIANAIKPGSAETDPRSSDFGKIKVGNTRFDFTGGAGSLIVLASRIASQSSKSTTSGVVKPLNTGQFGAQTSMDVLVNFLEGKTTPAVGAIISLLKNADYKGQKPTVGSIASNVALPITLQNALQLKDDNSTSAVVGVLLDALGVNATTYTPTKTDWTSSPGVELQAFQKKVGDQKFQQANDEYNTQVATFMATLQNNDKYKALSDTQKQAVITKKKDQIKADIFKKNGFTYKRAKPQKTPTI